MKAITPMKTIPSPQRHHKTSVLQVTTVQEMAYDISAAKVISGKTQGSFLKHVTDLARLVTTAQEEARLRTKYHAEMPRWFAQKDRENHR